MRRKSHTVEFETVADSPVFGSEGHVKLTIAPVYLNGLLRAIHGRVTDVTVDGKPVKA